MFKPICAVSFLLFLCSIAYSAQPAAGEVNSLTVDSIVFSTGVESKQPVGIGAEFEPSLGKVYCWTKISARPVPTGIKYVWYKNDRKVFEFPLSIKYPSCRVWSNKNISSGQWKVEIQNDDGVVLTTANFSVK
jgi:hypothetical protein